MTEIKAKKPHIVVANKNERSCAITHIAIPGNIRANKNDRGELRDTRN